MGGMIDSGWEPTRLSEWARSFFPTPPATIPDPTNWLNRIKAVKEGGIAAVADTVIAGWLTADFREREPQTTAHEGHAARHPGARLPRLPAKRPSTLDQRAFLPKINSPTLVIAGRHDTAPVAAGEFIPSRSRALP